MQPVMKMQIISCLIYNPSLSHMPLSLSFCWDYSLEPLFARLIDGPL